MIINIKIGFILVKYKEIFKIFIVLFRILTNRIYSIHYLMIIVRNIV
jgi:hypothetical protein